MVNLTISLSEETVQRLRKTVKTRFGGRRGALSGLIEDSVRERLEEFEMTRSEEMFKAIRGEHLVSEAASLEELATNLEKMSVDPRSVRIVSTKKLAPIVRAGLRGRRV